MSYLDLKGAIRNYLVDQGLSVIEIIEYKELTKSGGGCSTCYYTDYTMEIKYIDGLYDQKIFVYHGQFSELIRELTD